jgi:hypothetical protein
MNSSANRPIPEPIRSDQSRITGVSMWPATKSQAELAAVRNKDIYTSLSLPILPAFQDWGVRKEGPGYTPSNGWGMSR